PHRALPRRNGGDGRRPGPPSASEEAESAAPGPNPGERCRPGAPEGPGRLEGTQPVGHTGHAGRRGPAEESAPATADPREAALTRGSAERRILLAGRRARGADMLQRIGSDGFRTHILLLLTAVVAFPGR